MRVSLICVLLLAGSIGLASEREDRTDIERVVKALHDSSTSTSQKRLLFTVEAQNEIDRVAEWDQRIGHPPESPWSEKSAAGIAIHSIRFVTPDVAMVEGALSQYGSMILVRRTPVLIVLKREGPEWKIAAFRVLYARW